jgi:ribosomal protein S18 acetylase RimI-like enzyme
MVIHTATTRIELALARFGGEVHDRGNYVAVKTPALPDYHWGNYLVFDAAPGKGDYERWTALYRQEFAFCDEIRHMSFAWDTASPDPGESAEFQAHGFDTGATITLSAEEVIEPPRLNREITVRQLDDADDDQVVRLWAISFGSEDERAGLETFFRDQLAFSRAHVPANASRWFGAFSDGRPAAILRLVRDGRIGLINDVGVHPDFRRRGIAGRLVWEATKKALEGKFVDTMLIEADAESEHHTARLYESIGFRPSGTNYDLEWST